MSIPTVTEINCETQEVTVREMTDEEYQNHLNAQEESRLAAEAAALEEEAKTLAKASALAKLTALGLTEEEIEALVK